MTSVFKGGIGGGLKYSPFPDRAGLASIFTAIFVL